METRNINFLTQIAPQQQMQTAAATGGVQTGKAEFDKIMAEVNDLKLALTGKPAVAATATTAEVLAVPSALVDYYQTPAVAADKANKIKATPAKDDPLYTQANIAAVTATPEFQDCFKPETIQKILLESTDANGNVVPATFRQKFFANLAKVDFNKTSANDVDIQNPFTATTGAASTNPKVSTSILDAANNSITADFFKAMGVAEQQKQDESIFSLVATPAETKLFNDAKEYVKLQKDADPTLVTLNPLDPATIKDKQPKFFEILLNFIGKLIGADLSGLLGKRPDDVSPADFQSTREYYTATEKGRTELSGKLKPTPPIITDKDIKEAILSSNTQQDFFNKISEKYGNIPLQIKKAKVDTNGVQQFDQQGKPIYEDVTGKVKTLKDLGFNLNNFSGQLLKDYGARTLGSGGNFYALDLSDPKNYEKYRQTVLTEEVKKDPTIVLKDNAYLIADQIIPEIRTLYAKANYEAAKDNSNYEMPDISEVDFSKIDFAKIKDKKFKIKVTVDGKDYDVDVSLADLGVTEWKIPAGHFSAGNPASEIDLTKDVKESLTTLGFNKDNDNRRLFMLNATNVDSDKTKVDRLETAEDLIRAANNPDSKVAKTLGTLGITKDNLVVYAKMYTRLATEYGFDLSQIKVTDELKNFVADYRPGTQNSNDQNLAANIKQVQDQVKNSGFLSMFVEAGKATGISVNEAKDLYAYVAANDYQNAKNEQAFLKTMKTAYPNSFDDSPDGKCVLAEAKLQEKTEYQANQSRISYAEHIQHMKNVQKEVERFWQDGEDKRAWRKYTEKEKEDFVNRFRDPDERDIAASVINAYNKSFDSQEQAEARARYLQSLPGVSNGFIDVGTVRRDYINMRVSPEDIINEAVSTMEWRVSSILNNPRNYRSARRGEVSDDMYFGAEDGNSNAGRGSSGGDDLYNDGSGTSSAKSGKGTQAKVKLTAEEIFLEPGIYSRIMDPATAGMGAQFSQDIPKGDILCAALGADNDLAGNDFLKMAVDRAKAPIEKAQSTRANNQTKAAGEKEKREEFFKNLEKNDSYLKKLTDGNSRNSELNTIELEIRTEYKKLKDEYLTGKSKNVSLEDVKFTNAFAVLLEKVEGLEKLEALPHAIEGERATLTLNFSTLPGTFTDNMTFNLNGVVFVFKNNPNVQNPLEIKIGQNSSETMDNLMGALNSSTDARINVAEYTVGALTTDTGSNVTDKEIVITYKTPGVVGNSFYFQGATEKSYLEGGVDPVTATTYTQADLEDYKGKSGAISNYYRENFGGNFISEDEQKILDDVKKVFENYNVDGKKNGFNPLGKKDENEQELVDMYNAYKSVFATKPGSQASEKLNNKEMLEAIIELAGSITNENGVPVYGTLKQDLEGLKTR